MRLNILILLATITLGFGLTYMLQSPMLHTQSKTDESGAITGKDLPVFSMQALDGKTYQSKDFTGKTVLINFWATWCPPCIAEFPRLLQLARIYPDNLILLAVSSDQDGESIKHFLGKFDGEYAEILKQDNVLIIHDKDSSITFNLFQTFRLPETILASPDLKMLHKFVGADWTIEDVQKFLPKRDF